MFLEIFLAVFFLLSVLIVIKFLHHIIKAVLLIGALLCVLLIVFGVFVFLDAKDIKDHVTTSPSRLAYAKDGTVVAMLTIDPTKMQTESKTSALPEGLQVIAKKDLAQLDAKDPSSLLGPAYKLLLFDDSFFDTLTLTTVDFQSQQVPAQVAKDIMRSSDPIDSYLRDVQLEKDPAIRDLGKKKMLEQDPKAEEAVRSIAFLLLFSEAMKPTNLPEVFAGVRKGTVVIYPSTALVEMIRVTPSSLVKLVMTQVSSGIGSQQNTNLQDPSLNDAQKQPALTPDKVTAGPVPVP